MKRSTAAQAFNSRGGIFSASKPIARKIFPSPLSRAEMGIGMVTGALGLALVLLVGCATQEAHWDATMLREESIGYYSDQVMDNLIRGKLGIFMLHVDVTSLSAQVTSKLAATVQGGQTLNRTAQTQTTDSNVSTASASRAPTGATVGSMLQKTLGTVGTATLMATRPFTVQLNPERDDQLTVSTSPEVNDPSIYHCYINFLKLKDGTSTFNPTADPGPDLPDAVVSVVKKSDVEKLTHSHFKLQPGKVDENGVAVPDTTATHYFVPGTKKNWGGDTYYIPYKFRKLYFQLCAALAGRIANKTPKGGGGAGPTAAAQTVTPNFTAQDIADEDVPSIIDKLKSRLELVPRYIFSKEFTPEEKNLLETGTPAQKKSTLVDVFNRVVKGKSLKFLLEHFTTQMAVPAAASPAAPGATPAPEATPPPGDFTRQNRRMLEKAFPGLLKTLTDKESAATRAAAAVREEPSTEGGGDLPNKPNDTPQSRQIRDIYNYLLAHPR